MKKALFAIGALSVMMAVSCNKESRTPEVAGEEEALITGISVLSCPIDGDSYVPYAYGLFNSTTDVTVKLLSGYKYQFNARTGQINNMKFCLNSATWEGSLSDVDNTFHYGTAIRLTDDWCWEYPEGDLYFGETCEYTPTQGGTVTIDMERVSFCLSISVQNFSEGVVRVRSISANTLKNDIVIDYPTTSYNSQYVMKYFGTSFRTPDYYEEFDITAELTNADNVTVPLGSATIKVKRNHITKVKINANPPSTESQFSITYSEDPIVDSEEDTYNIGGGETIDTPIE